MLQPGVDIKTVLSQLMERLSNYAASSAEVCVYPTVKHNILYTFDFLFLKLEYIQVLPEFLQVEAFAKFSSAIGKVYFCISYHYVI